MKHSAGARSRPQVRSLMYRNIVNANKLHYSNNVLIFNLVCSMQFKTCNGEQ
jgi:hypothetical protein